MKKVAFYTALLSCVACVGLTMGSQAHAAQTSSEGYARLKKVAALMQDNFISAIQQLNGFSRGGSVSGKSSMPTERRGVDTAVSTGGDPYAQIICVENGRYVVSQLYPSYVGKHAMATGNPEDDRYVWRDAAGIEVGRKIIEGLNPDLNNDGKTLVEATYSSDGVVLNERTGLPIQYKIKWLAVNHKFLMGDQYKKDVLDQKRKLFCATPVQILAPIVDSQESARLK